ncbi:alkylphosphonate utilization protein, partial [bacterium]
MGTLPRCPQCGSEYTYEDGPLYVCPECSHEWARDGGDDTDSGAESG